MLVLLSLLHFIFPRWLSTTIFILFIISLLTLAWVSAYTFRVEPNVLMCFCSIFQNSGRAFRDANSSSVGRGGLVRYHLPYIGELADRWVSEE